MKCTRIYERWVKLSEAGAADIKRTRMPGGDSAWVDARGGSGPDISPGEQSGDYTTTEGPRKKTGTRNNPPRRSSTKPSTKPSRIFDILKNK